MTSELPSKIRYAVARRGGVPRAAGRATPQTRFSRDEILEALRRWTREFGEPPVGLDLEPARARRMGQDWRADRFEADAWPTAKMITGQFGSLGAALEQAGFQSRRGFRRGVPNLQNSQAVLDAICKWVTLYGAVPMLADWDPARARRLGQDWRIARYYQGDWPSTRSVIARFGSMSAAIEAAGLPPRGRGQHGRGQLAENVSARLASAQRLGAAREAQTDATELIDALHDLAAARRKRDPVAMHVSLIEIAAAALAWAEQAGVGPAK